jgi:hypothetical protein
MTANADLIARLLLRADWFRAEMNRLPGRDYAYTISDEKLDRACANALAAADRREMEAAVREAQLRETLNSCGYELDGNVHEGYGADMSNLSKANSILTETPSAAALRYQRMAAVVEAARDVAAGHEVSEQFQYGCTMCSLVKALSALDEPTQGPERECPTCADTGWESYGLGRGDPHFRECPTCHNPGNKASP